MSLPILPGLGTNSTYKLVYLMGRLRRPRRVPKEDPDELARNIGRKVAELRLAQGMTQQELATELRASVQWVSRIENGAENLTLATLAKVANALGVVVVDLFAAPRGKVRRAGRGRPKKATAD